LAGLPKEAKHQSRCVAREKPDRFLSTGELAEDFIHIMKNSLYTGWIVRYNK